MKKILVSLISTSVLDLESAKVLYKQRLYHTSLFCFQQSIEKAYKTFALMTGQIQLEDLQGIGHNYFKLLRKTFKTTFSDSSDTNLFYLFDFLLDDIDISKDEVNSTINNSKKEAFFNMSDTEFNNFIAKIETIKQHTRKYLLSNAGQEKLLALSHPNNENNLTENIKLDEVDLEQIFVFIDHSITIHLLGLLTTAHSEQTRYPFYNVGDINLIVKCPIDIYNIDMPIIKNMESLIDMAEGAINRFKDEVESFQS